MFTFGIRPDLKPHAFLHVELYHSDEQYQSLNFFELHLILSFVAANLRPVLIGSTVQSNLLVHNWYLLVVLFSLIPVHVSSAKHAVSADSLLLYSVDFVFLHLNVLSLLLYFRNSIGLIPSFGQVVGKF